MTTSPGVDATLRALIENKGKPASGANRHIDQGRDDNPFRNGANATYASQVVAALVDYHDFVDGGLGYCSACQGPAGNWRHGKPAATGSAEPEPTRLSARLLRRSQLAELPPVEPLIADTLSLRSSVILIGPTGAGKTFLALSWACCVATGTRWLGRDVVRAPVLYIVGEGASGLDARVAAWEEMWGTTVGDSDLVFAIRPDSLVNPNTWADITVEARAMGARLVVLDTFSSLAPDADETKDAATTMRRLGDLAAAIDGTAVLVHHPGWGDVERARGGSQIEANADEVVLLRGNAHSDLVEMERKKVKEGVAGGKTWLRRKVVGESVAIDLATPAAALAVVGDAVEDTVRDLFGGDRVSPAQIRDALIERLGLSRTVAYEHIKRLQAAGVLTRDGGTDNRPMFKVI